MNVNYGPYSKYFADPLAAKGDGNSYISFIDPDVLRLMGVNKLSYKSASQIQSLKGVFKGQKDLDEFNEFQYWGVKTLAGGNSFADCSNLTEITLPPSCTDIPNFSFLNCSSLKVVTILAEDFVLGQYAFEGCPDDLIILTPNAKNPGIGRMIIEKSFIIN